MENGDKKAKLYHSLFVDGRKYNEHLGSDIKTKRTLCSRPKRLLARKKDVLLLFPISLSTLTQHKKKNDLSRVGPRNFWKKEKLGHFLHCTTPDGASGYHSLGDLLL